MRILSICNCPAQPHLGGGYVIRNFVEGLRTLGHEVDLLEPEDYELFQFMRPRAFTHRQTLGMFQAVRQRLRSHRYDLIELWGGEAWLATRWLRSLGGKRPVVVQHTNGPEPRYAEGGGTRKVRRFTQRVLAAGAFTHADAIVTVSSYDQAWLKAHPRFKTCPVAVVEPALPPEMLDLPFTPRASLRIGFCGSWLPRKGIQAVVAAVTRLHRELPGLTLALAGVGNQFKAAEVFPAEIAARVEVHPMIRDKARLREFYQGLSVLLWPSQGESFGLVLPEAMACGCAVVATPVGFASSLTNGREAVLLERATAEQLYSATLRLLREADERNRIALGGWERVQAMRWPEACRRLDQFYRTLLDEATIRT